jgi:hypothetical protein
MDRTLDRELKKGSAELLILACLEGRPRHGYDVARRIADESGGAIRFNVAAAGSRRRTSGGGGPTPSRRPGAARWPSSGPAGRCSPRP